MIYKLIIPDLNTLKKFHQFAKVLLKKIKINILDFNPGSITVEFWGDFKEIDSLCLEQHLKIKNILEIKDKKVNDFRFACFSVQGLNHPHDINAMQQSLLAVPGIRKVEIVFHLKVIKIYYDSNQIDIKAIKKALRKTGLSIEMSCLNQTVQLKKYSILKLSVLLLFLISFIVLNFYPVSPLTLNILFFAFVLAGCRAELISGFKQFKFFSKKTLNFSFLVPLTAFFYGVVFPGAAVSLIYLICSSMILLKHLFFLLNYYLIEAVIPLEVFLNRPHFLNPKTVEPSSNESIVLFDGKIYQGEGKIEPVFFHEDEHLIKVHPGFDLFCGEKVIDGNLQIKPKHVFQTSLFDSVYQFVVNHQFLKYPLKKWYLPCFFLLLVLITTFFLINKNISLYVIQLMLLFHLITPEMFTHPGKILSLFLYLFSFKNQIFIQNYEKIYRNIEFKNIIVDSHVLNNLKLNFLPKVYYKKSIVIEKTIQYLFSITHISSYKIKNVIRKLALKYGLKPLALFDYRQSDHTIESSVVESPDLKRKIFFGKFTELKVNDLIKQDDLYKTGKDFSFSNEQTFYLTADNQLIAVVVFESSKIQNQLQLFKNLNNYSQVYLLNQEKNDHFQSISLGQARKLENSILCYDPESSVDLHLFENSILCCFGKMNYLNQIHSDLILQKYEPELLIYLLHALRFHKLQVRYFYYFFAFFLIFIMSVPFFQSSLIALFSLSVLYFPLIYLCFFRVFKKKFGLYYKQKG